MIEIVLITDQAVLSTSKQSAEFDCTLEWLMEHGQPAQAFLVDAANAPPHVLEKLPTADKYYSPDDEDYCMLVAVMG
jgi:hypothetical protein